MDLIGKVFAGRYEIREEVGKGGMALVYKAWCNMLNRWVAIKVLKEEFKDDKEFVRRFNVEAQAAAGISNPHVVAIHDVGYEDGLYYIAMEYIEGITLKEYIEEKGCIPWKEAAGYAAQICEGLAAAHKANVIHRDIKPQNIIMTPEGVLKVTDFGIARASTQATMTMGGNAIGTVHYLSPEQARGGYTDQRTDVYSLGVVLYEMLTGELPFTDDSPVAVAIKHIQETPTPIRRLKTDVPEAMEAVTLRAMNKEQGNRYATAEEFLADIQRVLKNPRCVIDQKTMLLKNDDEDMGTTIKMDSIDQKAIAEYDNLQRERAKRGTGSGKKRKRPAVPKTERSEERALRELEEKRKKKEQRKKERRLTWIAILAAVLVVSALGFAFVSMTNSKTLFTGGERVEIPNLVNMDLEKAQKQFKGEFNVIQKGTQPSDMAVGAILEQDPPAGEMAQKKENMVIRVIVSAGNNTVNMESFIGLESKKAQEKAKDAGYRVNVKEIASDTVEKGMVVEQDPKVGAAVTPGALVTLYVSNGEVEEKDDDDQVKPTAKPTKKPSSDSSEKQETDTSSTTNDEEGRLDSDNDNKPSSTPKPTATSKPADTSGGGSGSGGSGSSSGSESGGGSSSSPGGGSGSSSGSGSGNSSSGGSSSNSEGTESKAPTASDF